MPKILGIYQAEKLQGIASCTLQTKFWIDLVLQIWAVYTFEWKGAIFQSLGSVDCAFYFHSHTAFIPVKLFRS